MAPQFFLRNLKIVALCLSLMKLPEAAGLGVDGYAERGITAQRSSE
jgi:hypothetical protein